MLEHLTQQGVVGRLELALVDRGVTATGWLQVACIATTLLHLSQGPTRRRPTAVAA